MNILVDCNEEIDFLAKRFYKFSSNDQLKVLDLETLCDILTNPNLCLYDESCLLYFILDLVKEDKKFYCLFEYLEFTELTVNDIEMFINIFNINYLSGSIWKSLCSRLVQKINYESSITRYSNDINTTEHYPVFDPNDNNANQKMNGIIRYLSEKCNGNIMEKNVINIKYSDEHPINISSIVDLDVDSSFYTSAKPGSFIMIDFKDNFVIPQFYSIKSAGFANLRSWVFEISSDGENWKEIDRHDDSADLKKKKYNFYLSNS
ncbi:hypothetical protein TRFO_28783 [Tritrichomonas foetus]|uniref:F5/8 type C domain-containing protein n=1 Tax=Tritrichomonas foetus TaxID=1144522 RepID=A0A1J4JY16_9EUKA|nr:hypothetical protein TRFO_28783 [Tritrichomonas foetus]|eukprot:OHT03883.1 hypothetical protein TRFO_28783 [Tritrichomonas foetus]